MRVVLASFDRVPSAKGASRHILRNREILSAEHEVSLVSLGDEPMPGVRHLAVQLREPNWLRRALAFHQKMRAIFDKNSFDAYHVRSPWEGLAVPVGERLIYEVNGLYSIEARYHHPALYSQPAALEKLRLLELALLDRASAIVTPSRITAEHLVELGVERERITVVHNVPTIEPAIEPANRQLASSVDRPVRFCYIGTLAPWQGLDSLVRGLARLSVPWELSIRTPSAERHQRALLKLATKLGVRERVNIAEPLEALDLRAWLSTQDVAAAPLVACERNLVQGGMPLKILDAMAAGLPVLAPDLPVVSDLLGADHPTYRRHRDAELTALALELALSKSLRARLGEQLRARVRELFAPAAQQAALLSVYRAIAA